MGSARIHHAAITVNNFEWYKDFFEEIFDFTVCRTQGDAPKRNIWFQEGFQLMEDPAAVPVEGSLVDHLSIAVEDIPGTVAKAIAKGCAPHAKAHWFILPNGVKIELKSL